MTFSLLLAASTGHAAKAAGVASTTHPGGVFYDFSTPVVPFAAYAPDGGVASGARFAIKNGALVITNEFAGSFGVDAKIKTFDANKLGDVFFDYRLAPDVKVNIFFKIKDAFHGVVFNGPARVAAGSVLLGRLQGIVADGQWHQAHIPLRDWLRKIYPKDDSLPVEQIVIGNWDNTGYLMAGIGGNGPGAQWSLDNFALVGAGPAEAKFQLNDDKGAPLGKIEGFSYALDSAKAVPLTASAFNVKAGDGFHIVRVRDKAAKEVAATAFLAAATPPRIEDAVLQNNTLSVLIPNSAGLEPRALKFSIGERSFDATSPFLQWDGAAHRLNLDAAGAGLQWPDKAKVTWTVDGVKDVLGRSAPAKSGSLAVDYAAHEQAPPPPVVAFADAGAAPANTLADTGTFEESLDQWAQRDAPTGAIVERDSTSVKSGKYAVRLTCPTHAAPFGAWIRQPTQGAFDAAKYPVISFDYRVPPLLRSDFMVSFRGTIYAIHFTDRDNPLPRLGEVPNVVADDKWHHTEFNLATMLRAIAPNAPSYQVDAMSLGDSGWLGNARGTHFWIDNFQFVPAVKGAPLRATARIKDVTGLKATSWLLDERTDSTPPATAKGGAEVEATVKGRRWLHVRAQNGAGQWGPPVHIPIWADGAAPVVGAVTPANDQKSAPEQLPVLGGATLANNQKSAPEQLILTVSDDLAVDNSSFALQVQDQVYTIGDALNYDDEKARLVWTVSEAFKSGKLKPLADGTRIEWKLKPVRDVVGNASTEAAGAWILDYAQDKSGPAAQVSSPSHPLLSRVDFSAENLPWTVVDGAKIERVRREDTTREDTTREAGNPPAYALKITSTVDNGQFAVLANLAWDAATYSILSFDYKIPRTANLALRLTLGREGGAVGLRPFHISLNGEATRSLGQVRGIVADNAWHHTQIDLRTFLRRGLDGAQLQSLEFVDAAQKTPANTSWEIANFIIAKPANGKVKLDWKTHDATGVQKYRFAWDQTPATKPVEETAATERTLEAGPGTWYAHVQAQDGAGNWGAVTHFPVLVQ